MFFQQHNLLSKQVLTGLCVCARVSDKEWDIVLKNMGFFVYIIEYIMGLNRPVYTAPDH